MSIPTPPKQALKTKTATLLNQYFNNLLLENVTSPPEVHSLPLHPPGKDLQGETPANQIEASSVRLAAQEDALVSQYPPTDYLLFSTKHSRLAIPLRALEKVISPLNKMIRLPHQPVWSFGILRHQERLIKVINTDAAIDFRQKNDGMTPKYVLVLAKSNLGLSSHAISDVVKLEYDQICWHKQKPSETRWSLGLTQDSLHFVLNTEEIHAAYGKPESPAYAKNNV
ncbi:MAG: chemotaxis protein CheW [Gammaproteobacteria bacterium]|nr:chemotaxis protein CheW [Gammaproteobacteria bacterium]